MRITNAKGHTAGAGSMLFGEVGGLASRFAVEDEIDSALAKQADLLGAMSSDEAEAHRFEDGLKYARLRGGEFDELDAVEAGGVALLL